MPITALGSASGLDLESIVTSLVAVERDPKLNLYAQKEGELSVTLSAYSALKGSIESFQKMAELLSDPDNFNQRTVDIRQPTDVETISVTASGDSTAGSFDIEVLALAQGSRAESADGQFTSSSDVVSASGGNLTLATASGESFDVAIDAGATLEEIREAINSSEDNHFVSANIINTGGESKLVLTSNITGAGNDLIVSNDNAELDSISTVATGGGGAGLSIAAEDMAQSAQISVDNIVVTNDTNTFKDAIQDLTITAKELTNVDDPARLTISHDTESVKFNINAFVDSYNELITIIDDMTAKEAVLNGDSITRKFEQQLVRELSTEIIGAGNLTTLFDAGVSLVEGGKLEVRSSGVSPLNEVLENNFTDLENLFAGDDGLATKINDFLETYVDKDGVLVQAEDSINEQLDRIDEDRDKFLARMVDYEDRLRKQYTNLDILVGSLNAQSDYITSQLKAISSSSS